MSGDVRMLTNPREARIAACAILLLVGGAIANIAYLQISPRERRLTQIPIGLSTPLPDAKRTAETRRSSGPVTLSLASLLDTAPAPVPTQPEQPNATSAPAAPVPAQTIDSVIAMSIDPPVEAKPRAEPSLQAPTRQAELVRMIQGELTTRGYAPGAVDGDAGLMTRAAILAFEHDAGLPATAEASDTVLAALRAPAPARRPTRGANWQSPSRTALALVATVQQQLTAVGHLTGAQSGQLDARTIAAIRSFESANDMLATGRISAPLVARLQRAGMPRARVASGQ